MVTPARSTERATSVFRLTDPAHAVSEERRHSKGRVINDGRNRPEQRVLPVVGDMADIHQSTLSNGLRVAIEPDGTVPIVGVSLSYDVGSRVESPGEAGFAHLFEHMMFQGSANVPKDGFVAAIQGHGGDVNGSTGVERATFYHSLPSHQWMLGLWMEADRMRSLNITQEVFDAQRQAVLAEFLERVEQRPYGRAHGQITELSYECFGYGHPVIGYRSDLEQATLGAIMAFHGRWYVPDNAVLAVAGDVDVEEVLDTVYAYFAALERGPDRSLPDFSEPRRMLPKHTRTTDPLAPLPAVFVNHPAVPYGHPDFFTYEVLETLLFRGPSSRLQRSLVGSSGEAVSVKGGYEAHRGPSLFSLFAVLPEGGEPSGLIGSYADELERLTRERVSDDELDKVRNQLRAFRVFGRQGVISRANALARSLQVQNDPHFESRYLEQVNRVSSEDVIRVARRDFDPNACVVLEVLPS